MRLKSITRACVTLGSAAAIALSMAPQATAASENGWIGPTPIINGTSYLHYSTISNTPLFADTRIYTSFGYAVPAYTMGVRSRLFKSGALCRINPVKFNATSTSSLTGPTSGDCGPGSYNSHGFVLVSDGTDFQEFVTFPTNPLNWGTTARTADTAPKQQTFSRSSNGQTFGSAANVNKDDALPDLILSIGTKGESGYVRSADLPATPKTQKQAEWLPRSTDSDGKAVATSKPKTVALLKEDGKTVIGQFKVG